MTGVDGLEFIVSLADSLAWPAASIVALLILEPYLNKLSSLLEKIKYKDLEFIFDQGLQKTAKRVESLDTDDDSGAEEPLLEVIDSDPRMATIKVWASVEAAIESLANAHLKDLPKGRRVPTSRRVRLLREANVIDPPLASVLEEMRYARNVLAHGEDIPLHDDTVRLFLRTAERVESIVEQRIDRGNTDNL